MNFEWMTNDPPKLPSKFEMNWKLNVGIFCFLLHHLHPNEYDTFIYVVNGLGCTCINLNLRWKECMSLVETAINATPLCCGQFDEWASLSPMATLKLTQNDFDILIHSHEWPRWQTTYTAWNFMFLLLLH